MNYSSLNLNATIFLLYPSAALASDPITNFNNSKLGFLFSCKHVQWCRERLTYELDKRGQFLQ